MPRGSDKEPLPFLKMATAVQSAAVGEPEKDPTWGSAVGRASLVAVLAAGAFAISEKLQLPLAVQIAGAGFVTLSALAVWYFEYRPASPRAASPTAVRRIAFAFAFLFAGAAISLSFVLAGDDGAWRAVPQHSSTLLAETDDGSYMVGASGSADGVPGAVVLKVRADGRLDRSFGLDGVSFHRSGAGAVAVDSLLTAEGGGAVLTGTFEARGEGEGAYVAQLAEDGSALPHDFQAFGVDEESEAVAAREPSGRLLLGVTSRLSEGGTRLVEGFPLLAGGELETGNTFDLLEPTGSGVRRSYGINGYATGPIECGRVSSVRCRPLRALLVRPDGSAVVATVFISTVDAKGGRSHTSTGVILGHAGSWNALALDEENRILAGGTEVGGTHAEPEFIVVRLNRAHWFDRDFAEAGIARIDLPADRSEVGAIVPGSDGTVLVAGRSATYQRDGVAVVRLQSDGSLDRSFGSGGIVLLHPLRVSRPLTRQVKTAMAVDPAGKITVAEVLSPKRGWTTGGRVALVRLDSDGRLDRSFGHRGIARFDLDFRGVQVERPADVYLDGGPSSDLMRGADFVLASLGAECRGSGGPVFTCQRRDGAGQPFLEVRLRGTGRPLLRSAAGPIDSAPLGLVRSLNPGDDTWIKTTNGAVYCSALIGRFVCANGSRHGFVLSRGSIHTW